MSDYGHGQRLAQAAVDQLAGGVSVPDGPLEVAPVPLAPMDADSREALLAAELTGVPLGAWDREALRRLAGMSTPTVLALASLIRRAVVVADPEPEAAKIGLPLARIASYLEAQTGTLSLTWDGGGGGECSVSAYFGREAPDSSMVGGAAYGVGPLDVALAQAAGGCDREHMYRVIGYTDADGYLSAVGNVGYRGTCAARAAQEVATDPDDHKVVATHLEAAASICAAAQDQVMAAGRQLAEESAATLTTGELR